MIFPSPSRQRLYTTFQLYSSIVSELTSNTVHAGPDSVSRLERAVGEYTGSPHVLAVNQARVGIYLALRAAMKPGKNEVLLSPFTIYDVVNMVLCAGGKPVFVDILPETCTMDPELTKAAMGEATAAVLITHTHVFASGVEEIAVLCRERGIVLVEDCAVAYGTRKNGTAVGTFGDVGVFSFGLFKNVNAVFGGAVVTKDRALFEKMAAEQGAFPEISKWALLRRILYGLIIVLVTNPVFFRFFTFWVFRAGVLYDIEMIKRKSKNDPNPVRRNSIPESMKVRMSPAQARWALMALPNVMPDLKKRLTLASIYRMELGDLAEVKIPEVALDCSDGFVVYPIRVGKNQGEVLKHLMRLGRDCPTYYYRNCSKLECFREFYKDCPKAEEAATLSILLPTYPSYGESQARRTAQAVRSYFQTTRPS